MTFKEQRALDAFLQSVVYCQRFDPIAPALSLDDEIACQGNARNRTLEASK